MQDFFSNRFDRLIVERPNDIWFRRVGIPVVVLLGNLFYAPHYQYDWHRCLIGVALDLVYLIPAWGLSVNWLMMIRQRYQQIDQTRHRILLTFAGYFGITALGQVAMQGLVWALGLGGTFLSVGQYLLHTLVGFGSLVIIGSLYEISYYLRLYRLAVAESQAIQKAGLQNQFDSLKNQVNPHFLFNSLNSLSALIGEDREQAGLFLDELATVYRYLLQTNQQQLVPLKKEISFIRSFLYLLKVRFGAAFEYDIQIHPDQLDLLIPPLTLQTLVENAIQHNVAEAGQPLCICIETVDSCLTVTNSLQRKNRLLNTSPGGLSRLTVQFQALKLPTPRITDNGQAFSVWLPLAPKNAGSFVALP